MTMNNLKQNVKISFAKVKQDNTNLSNYMKYFANEQKQYNYDIYEKVVSLEAENEALKNEMKKIRADFKKMKSSVSTKVTKVKADAKKVMTTLKEENKVVKDLKKEVVAVKKEQAEVPVIAESIAKEAVEAASENTDELVVKVPKKVTAKTIKISDKKPVQKVAKVEVLEVPDKKEDTKTEVTETVETVTLVKKETKTEEKSDIKVDKKEVEGKPALNPDFMSPELQKFLDTKA